MIGIAHLTLLALRPPELVTTAAEAGYDFVGVRVKAVTEGEHQYPMAPGSPMSRETLLRLSDTGLTVRDVEFLQIRPDTGADDWMPALEAGAALLDAPHIQRGGSTMDDVRALEPSLVPGIQLCDGPLATPETLELPAALPLGMTADGSVLQVEARALRQVPGEGEFPLAELLAAVPVGTPISVEVPNAGLQAQLSPVAFAARNLRGVQNLEASRVG